jgi:hypothetical protein
MTIREIAQGLGCSVGYCHGLTKRGMPVDTIEVARAWYRRTVRLHCGTKIKRHLWPAVDGAGDVKPVVLSFD